MKKISYFLLRNIYFLYIVLAIYWAYQLYEIIAGHYVYEPSDSVLLSLIGIIYFVHATHRHLVDIRRSPQIFRVEKVEEEK